MKTARRHDIIEVLADLIASAAPATPEQIAAHSFPCRECGVIDKGGNWAAPDRTFLCNECFRTSKTPALREAA